MSRDHIWCVKYLSACIILVAMIMHVAGFTPWNSITQMIGAAGWIYVGYRWDEKAIILNFAPQFLIIIPMLVWIYWLQN